MTREAVGLVLKNRILEAQRLSLLPSSFSTLDLASHSLRRGGATYMQQHDAPEWLIKEMGRWKSEVFRLYTDPTWSSLLSKLQHINTT